MIELITEVMITETVTDQMTLDHKGQIVETVSLMNMSNVMTVIEYLEMDVLGCVV